MELRSPRFARWLDATVYRTFQCIGRLS